MTDQSTGPRCGNNPNYRMSDGDREVVDGFRAYLAARAALRNRIAEALEQADYSGNMRRGDLADAVLPALYPELPWLRDGVLPAPAVPVPPTTHATALRETATLAERLPIPDRYRHHSRLGDAWDDGRDAAVRVLRRRADEAQQQPTCPTPESHNWGCGCPGDRLPLYSDRGVDTPGCDCGHNGMGMRWHDGGGCSWIKQLTDEGRRLLAEDDGGEAQQRPDTEAPSALLRAHVALAEQAGRDQAALARVRRLYESGPLGTCCSHLVGAALSGPGRVADEEPAETQEGPRTVCVCGHTRGEHLTVSGRLLCDACDPDSTANLVCRGFDAL